MRHVVVVAGIAFALGVGTTARAQTADELQSAGEEAARAGDFAGAIDKFKAADRVAPSAMHACLIALAYTRRNLWPQAEVFHTMCHERATAGDPLPPWVDAADKQIAAAIATANVAAITIVTKPANAGARITVSSFAQDESFAPRMIHLPPGRHELFAVAPGYSEARAFVDVKDRTPQRIEIELHPWGGVEAPPVAVASPPPPAASPVPWFVIGGGVVIGAVGGLLEGTWYLDAVHKVQGDVPGQPDVRTDLDTWRTRRDVVIGSYAVGAAAVITGVALRFTVFRPGGARLEVAPAPGGATVGVSWSR